MLLAQVHGRPPPPRVGQGGQCPESGACHPMHAFILPLWTCHVVLPVFTVIETQSHATFVFFAQHCVRLTRVPASHPRSRPSWLHRCSVHLTHPPDEHPGGCQCFPLAHKAAVMSHTCLFVCDTSASCPCSRKRLCRVPGIRTHRITLQSGSQPPTARRNPHLSASSLKFEDVVLDFSWTDRWKGCLAVGSTCTQPPVQPIVVCGLSASFLSCVTCLCPLPFPATLSF